MSIGLVVGIAGCSFNEQLMDKYPVDKTTDMGPPGYTSNGSCGWEAHDPRKELRDEPKTKVKNSRNVNKPEEKEDGNQGYYPGMWK